MTDYFVSLLNTWKKKAISFLPRLIPVISKSCQTYPNVVICNQAIQGIAKGVSAGVKLIRCGINCDAAPTGNRGSELIAVRTADDVIISTVAHSIINFNSYARCYV